MNAFDAINGVIHYIEDHITDPIDYDKAAEIACCPGNQFQRFFSYIAGISLSEYIRRRRLTLCVFDLQQGELSVTQTAMKYGYDSPASFTRAFRSYHGITPLKARDKGAVFSIYPRLTFQIRDVKKERSGDKTAVLGKIEFLKLPDVRMIGIRVMNGAGENPVPDLWKRIFERQTLNALERTRPVVDYFIGWMGEYDRESGRFTYIAGLLMPSGTPVPGGFDYRDLPACLVGNGYINGDFANGGVYRHSHNLTVEGIVQSGFEPDYSHGWSAEAYARDLAFDAEEGTINYFCPCREAVINCRIEY